MGGRGMAISNLKLPQGVSAHEFKSPALLAEGLALSVAKQLSEAVDARGTATLAREGALTGTKFLKPSTPRHSPDSPAAHPPTPSADCPPHTWPSLPAFHGSPNQCAASPPRCSTASTANPGSAALAQTHPARPREFSRPTTPGSALLRPPLCPVKY